jgi:hypothetical protein
MPVSTVMQKSGSKQHWVLEGIVVGLVGAAVFAIWFLVYDAMHGHPFRTPHVLGSVLLDNSVEDPLGGPSLVVIMRYTAVHGALFMAFGCMLAGLFMLADRDPRIVLGIFILLCCFQVFFVAMGIMAAKRFLDLVPWQAIALGNLLATVAMLAVLARAQSGHGRTRDPLEQDPLDQK